MRGTQETCARVYGLTGQSHCDKDTNVRDRADPVPPFHLTLRLHLRVLLLRVYGAGGQQARSVARAIPPPALLSLGCPAGVPPRFPHRLLCRSDGERPVFRGVRAQQLERS